MILNLNNAFMDYIKDRKNLPLICILAAVVLIILVLAIVMIVRAVNNKKRNRSETEEAVRALANVPPDEEYLPYTPAEEETPVVKAEEPAPAPVVVTEPEPVAEEAAQPAEEAAKPVEETTEPEPVAEEKNETAIVEEKTEEENKMAEKPVAPAKKEPAKKEVKKATSAKKAEPAKKPEAPKVSAANGKWIIEEVKGKFWLSLIAPNGQVMLESPTAYASLQSARSGVKTYQDNIAAERFEITEHKNGDSQVQVLNGRGGLLATSSTYSSRAQAESARDSIKRWASTTAIEEVSEKKD